MVAKLDSMIRLGTYKLFHWIYLFIYFVIPLDLMCIHFKDFSLPIAK